MRKVNIFIFHVTFVFVIIMGATDLNAASLENWNLDDITSSSVKVSNRLIGKSTQTAITAFDQNDQILQTIELSITNDKASIQFSVHSHIFDNTYSEISITQTENPGIYYVDVISHTSEHGWISQSFRLEKQYKEPGNCGTATENWQLEKIHMNSWGTVSTNFLYRDNVSISKLHQSRKFSQHLELAEYLLSMKSVSEALPNAFSGTLVDPLSKSGTEYSLESGDCEVNDSTITKAGCTGSCLLFAACIYTGCGGLVACGGCAMAGGVCAACISDAMGCDGGGGDGG